MVDAMPAFPAAAGAYFTPAFSNTSASTPLANYAQADGTSPAATATARRSQTCLYTFSNKALPSPSRRKR